MFVHLQDELVLLKIFRGPVIVEVPITHGLYKNIIDRLNNWLDQNKIDDFVVTPLLIHDAMLLEVLLNSYVAEDEDFDLGDLIDDGEERIH